MSKKALESMTETMFYVLMAFTRGEMCGTDIAEHIERRTRGRVRLGPGTLYAILGKFEGAGYIEETDVSGRRRTYKLTEKGRDAYGSELERLKACVADAETETE